MPYFVCNLKRKQIDIRIGGTAMGLFNRKQTDNTDQTLSTQREQKEFEKTDNTLDKENTKLQQSGQDKPERRRLFKKPKKEIDKELQRKDEPEIEKHSEQQKEKQPELEQTKDTKDQTKIRRDQEILRNGMTKSQQEAMAHDMRDMAIGQIYNIPGANVDYDEIDKMSKNNIRDASELADESLQNDGYVMQSQQDEISEAERAMEGYVKTGQPDIQFIEKLEEKYEPEIIAQAYVNVAKDLTRGEYKYLEKIEEKLDLGSERYECIFDNIRRVDKEADSVLDNIDLAFGREREW